ncbi:MAG: penicillin-binding protein [Bacteroidia bacterium]
MKNKKDILSRLYVVYIFLCVFSIAIVYRIITIQFIEGSKWKEKAEAYTTKVHEIEAVRGNIFDVNGSLLATSLPYYEVGMDVNAPSIDDNLFKSNRDSLAFLLSKLLKNKSENEFLKLLNNARKTGDRYIVLSRNVSYKNLQTIKTFPILRNGRRGGLVTMQTNKRERPFKNLAARTIGMARKGIKPVGLEGAYDSLLTGISGKRLMQKIAGGVWRPINDDNEVEPKDGSDIYTTIDINIQDVAEHALFKALVKNNASHGCVVLMEVKTGAIKAIANLARSRSDSSVYAETLNYAIGHPAEPGSTFKLASMLAVIDDYDISLDEKVNVENGKCMYYNITVRDAHEPETPQLSVQRIFETSSNVGVTKIITKYYGKTPQKFVDKLLSFKLDKPLGIAIPGEGHPFIKSTNHKAWSGVTLPQMSYGYETLMTPLQTLTLYNAVANNGKMVKPQFIKEIRRKGNTVERFSTEVMSEQIVKQSTIKKIKQLLEGVVENGTGRGLNITAFKVAGKTGTAQIAKIGKDKGKNAYGVAGQRTYQASFVGYFPADNPLYTCIVVINSPSNGIYYGGLVAGPVFKEIAEKVYSSSLDFLPPVNKGGHILAQNIHLSGGKGEDIIAVSKLLNIKEVKPNKLKDSQYYYNDNSDSTRIKLKEENFESQLKKGVIPNLKGLTAKDAVYILESNGFYTEIEGVGKIQKQIPEAGSKVNKGDKIYLTLS